MARPTCEGCRSIDVRRWHREGQLHIVPPAFSIITAASWCPPQFWPHPEVKSRSEFA